MTTSPRSRALSFPKAAVWLGLSLTLLLIASTIQIATAAPGDPSFVESRYPSKKLVDQEYTLKAGGMLRIDVDDIDVYVTKSDAAKSRVEVFVAGPDEERAVAEDEDPPEDPGSASPASEGRGGEMAEGGPDRSPIGRWRPM